MTFNPLDVSRTSGGSSSGSAALVAAGVCDHALGTDTGGSIRIPAAYCGIVGLKPTSGLVPVKGVFPLSQTCDHVGTLTRTVAQTATLLGVLAGRAYEMEAVTACGSASCVGSWTTRTSSRRSVSACRRRSNASPPPA